MPIVLHRYTLSMSLVCALLGGCSGSQPPIGADAMMAATASASPSSRVESQVRGGTSAGDLLYVSDDGNQNAVEVLTYPEGTPVATLTGFDIPSGLCVDRSGDVFVTNIVTSGASTIIEYAHGGTTPIQTLQDRGREPNGCAVNPVTGDLAVANHCRYTETKGCVGAGNILIYPRATGSPKTFRAPLYFESCTYDANGTLYADGFGHGRLNRFFELVKVVNGSRKLQKIPVHFTSGGCGIEDPGGIQWDGHYLSIDYPQGENIIPSVYRVDPSSGQVKSILTLRGTHSVFQSFIDGDTLIAPNDLGVKGQVRFYSYPKGYKLRKAIKGLDSPVSVVVSPGSNR